MKRLFGHLKHFLIPHECNDYHPHLLREFSVLVILFVSVSLFAVGELHQSAVTRNGWLAAVYSTALVDLTNQSRQIESLGGLRVNPMLEKAAELKARDMAEKGYFAHWSPDGKSPWHWIKTVGYSYMYAGENLAIDFTDSADVNRALMNSPTHRANIMNKNYTEIGVATHVGTYQGRETVFVVEMFATPYIAEVVPESGPVSREVTIADAEPALVMGAKTALAPVTTKVPSQAPIASNTSIASTSARREQAEGTSSGLFLSQILSNPHYAVGGGYMCMALLLMISLGGFATIELRKYHYPHIAHCVLLLAIIFSFGFIYQTLVFTPAVVL